MTGNTIPYRGKRFAVMEKRVNYAIFYYFGPADCHTFSINRIKTEFVDSGIINNGQGIVPDLCPVFPLRTEFPSWIRSPSLAWPTASCAKTPANSGSSTARIFPPLGIAASRSATAIPADFFSLGLLVPEIEPVDRVFSLVPHLDIAIP